MLLLFVLFVGPKVYLIGIFTKEIGNYIKSSFSLTSQKWQTIGWGVLLAILALMFLNAGGLKALQSMTLVTALPFSIIMLLFILSLTKALVIDRGYYDKDFSSTTVPWSGEHWKERLKQIGSFNDERSTEDYISTTVKSAFKELMEEFSLNGIDARINSQSVPKQIEI